MGQEEHAVCRSPAFGDVELPRAVPALHLPCWKDTWGSALTPSRAPSPVYAGARLCGPRVMLGLCRPTPAASGMVTLEEI